MEFRETQRRRRRWNKKAGRVSETNERMCIAIVFIPYTYLLVPMQCMHHRDDVKVECHISMCRHFAATLPSTQNQTRQRIARTQPAKHLSKLPAIAFLPPACSVCVCICHSLPLHAIVSTNSRNNNLRANGMNCLNSNRMQQFVFLHRGCCCFCHFLSTRNLLEEIYGTTE